MAKITEKFSVCLDDEGRLKAVGGIFQKKNLRAHFKQLRELFNNRGKK